MLPILLRPLVRVDRALQRRVEAQLLLEALDTVQRAIEVPVRPCIDCGPLFAVLFSLANRFGPARSRLRPTPHRRGSAALLCSFLALRLLSLSGRFRLGCRLGCFLLGSLPPPFSHGLHGRAAARAPRAALGLLRRNY